MTARVVVVFELTFDNQSDGLEATVRVPVKADFGEPCLVEQDEGIGLFEVVWSEYERRVIDLFSRPLVQDTSDPLRGAATVGAARGLDGGV
ncbi:hypothetical protein OHT17_02175 [Streptomyces sp. NBC_00371]|uniref:hypothetical protein n=1 Tax=Streptomyces sp. NBC_00371 TaxID=2975729 RepID=UPI002E26A571